MPCRGSRSQIVLLPSHVCTYGTGRPVLTKATGGLFVVPRTVTGHRLVVPAPAAGRASDTVRRPQMAVRAPSPASVLIRTSRAYALWVAVAIGRARVAKAESGVIPELARASVAFSRPGYGLTARVF